MGRTGYDTTGLYLDRLQAPRNASGGKKAVGTKSGSASAMEKPAKDPKAGKSGEKASGSVSGQNWQGKGEILSRRYRVAL
ncbi:hypothetical protein GQ607_014346 [Colletotrichum asianum]|uniref:Uncharacterized protein n=1 Tax=Colletotrichum asianum TaxID=702518 RepID=A0A8H3ZGL5_9PEZI|nr:hypothetical protein GQ607_014346 [Colletotrichum asianum]